jgi:mannosyltransferase
MAALGLWGLARDSAMGNDEVATRWAALLSLRQLAHLLRHVDAVHGLYYLLMHGWMAVGTSPVAMRVPSVLALAGAAAMVALIGRRLTGSALAGLFAGLIMTLPPAISYYAQTARSYPLVFAAVTGLTLLLLRAVDAERAGPPAGRAARWWAGYAVLIAVSGYLNEMALLVLLAHAATVLLARGRLRAAAHWAAAAAAGAALVVPLLLLSSRQDGAVAWIRRPGLPALRVLLRDYFGVTTLVAVILVACAVIAVLPERGGPWWRRGGLNLPSVALPLLVLPAAALIAESLVARPYYVDRYVLYGEAGAALLAGGGLARAGRWLARLARSPLLGPVPGVAVCLAALLLQLGPQHHVRTTQARMFDFGSPARYLAAHARPGDGALFFSAFFRKARLGYPAQFRDVADFAMAVPPARSGTFNGIDKPLPQISALMLSYQRIWVIGRSPSDHLAGVTRQEGAELRRQFRLAAHQHFRGMTVTLWQRQ